MRKIKYTLRNVSIAIALFASACGTKNPGGGVILPVPEKKQLTLVGFSEKQWTGVAVEKAGRIFVNFPNWAPSHTISVAELKDSVTVVPFPDAAWNIADSSKPASHLICVQAVFVDKNNFLWILDPANPQRNGKYLGVVDGGAKLLKVDLSTNQVVQTIFFNQPVITKNSYLNDVRIDEAKKVAYITDSNEGAIVVVDLTSGTSRRLLSKDPSTKSENLQIVVEDTVWRNPDGTLPVVHSDGIALSPGRDFIYWRALTGKSLYRIATALLLDSTQTDASLKGKPELVNILPPSDGIIFGTDGKLYLSSIEQNAVIASDAGKSAYIIAQDPSLKWPDSFSNGPDDYLYVTASQIHLKNPREPYKLFKFKVK